MWSLLIVCKVWATLCFRSAAEQYDAPSVSGKMSPAPLKPGSTVVLSLFSKHNVDMFKCWAAYFQLFRKGIKALDVVALDDEAWVDMQQWTRHYPHVVRNVYYGQNWSHYYAGKTAWFRKGGPHPGYIRRLDYIPALYQYGIWVFIRHLLMRGENVIHLDTDAWVLQDLWTIYKPLLKDYPHTSAIGSCDCFEQWCGLWGCTVNPGAMLFRSDAKMLALVNGVLHYWDTENFKGGYERDMHLLNRFLFEHNVSFKSVDSPYDDEKDHTHVAYGETLDGLRLLTIRGGHRLVRGSGAYKSCGGTPPNSGEFLASCKASDTIIVHVHGRFRDMLCQKPPAINTAIDSASVDSDKPQDLAQPGQINSASEDSDKPQDLAQLGQIDSASEESDKPHDLQPGQILHQNSVVPNSEAPPPAVGTPSSKSSLASGVPASQTGYIDASPTPTGSHDGNARSEPGTRTRWERGALGLSRSGEGIVSLCDSAISAVTVGCVAGLLCQFVTLMYRKTSVMIAALP